VPCATAVGFGREVGDTTRSRFSEREGAREKQRSSFLESDPSLNSKVEGMEWIIELDSAPRVPPRRLLATCNCGKEWWNSTVQEVSYFSQWQRPTIGKGEGIWSTRVGPPLGLLLLCRLDVLPQY